MLTVTLSLSLFLYNKQKTAQYQNNELSSDNHHVHLADKGSLHNVTRRQNRTYRLTRRRACVSKTLNAGQT